MWQMDVHIACKNVHYMTNFGMKNHFLSNEKTFIIKNAHALLFENKTVN